jgi:hypothetical protein
MKTDIRDRTNTYHIIYKTIQGRELTLTTIFTKLFRGVIHDIYKTIQGTKLKHTQYLQNYSGERTNTYTIPKKLIRGEN